MLIENQPVAKMDPEPATDDSEQTDNASIVTVIEKPIGNDNEEPATEGLRPDIVAEVLDNDIMNDSGPSSIICAPPMATGNGISGSVILESLSEEEDTDRADGMDEDSSTGGVSSVSGGNVNLQSHKDSASAAMAAAMASAMAMMTPTSPRSVTTASMSASGKRLI